MHQAYGSYTGLDAAVDYAKHLAGTSTDHMLELRYPDRRRIHNLKYYTWVEQQGKTYDEIQAQWYDRRYWIDLQTLADDIDERIKAFNSEVGLI
jgi:hypothetical protein